MPANNQSHIQLLIFNEIDINDFFKCLINNKTWLLKKE